MCYIPCSRFVLLSKPQFQQARTVSKKQYRNWNLWCPRNVSCLGLCLYLQERLPRPCYSLPCKGRAFITAIKNMETLENGRMRLYSLVQGYKILCRISKGCQKNRTAFTKHSQKKKKNWNGLCIECHLKQTRIYKTCGITFKLPLTPCWVSLGLLMNYLIGLDLILIGEFITWISIKTDAVLLSRSIFILWESISFSSWNGPLSLALASFEPRKALACYIASVFYELDERKRWKWSVNFTICCHCCCSDLCKEHGH